MPSRFSAIIQFFLGAVLSILLAGPAAADAYLFELVRRGQFDQARELQTHAKPTPEEVHWLEGIIAKRMGDIRLAEKHLREALRINPDYKQARLELAHLYKETDNYDGALHHMRALSRSTTNDSEQESYDRFLAAIRAERPWGLSFSLGVLPSTNVNRGSGETEYHTDFGTFTIDEESRGQSGVGVSAAASGFFRHTIGEGRYLLVSGSLQKRQYEDDQLGNEHASGSVEMGRHGKWGNAYFGLLTAVSMKDLDPVLVRYGARLRGALTDVANGTLGFTFSAEDQDQVDSDNRDGVLYNARVNWTRQLAPSTSGGFSLMFRIEKVESRHLSHNDFGFGLHARKQWPGGLVTGFNLDYERHEYVGNFPGSPAPRQDNQYRMGISLLHDRISFGGFAPRLSYSYTRQQSNIAFYDYDSHDIGLVFTRDF